MRWPDLTPDLVERLDRLEASARVVLEDNWLGASTPPSPALYPHQWSWDSAFIALGRSWYDEPRAHTELRSLFAGRWADGRVPHIVFDAGLPEEAYFPGPSFWQSSSSPMGPTGVETPGMPFAVAGPLFTAIRLWSSHALAELAAIAGADPGPHREEIDTSHIPPYGHRSRRNRRESGSHSRSRLLAEGLRQHGHAEAALEIGVSSVRLAERSGFREYYDPLGGTGHGSSGFSWSAALAIDGIERFRRARMG